MEKRFSKKIISKENKEYFLSNLYGSIDNIVKDIKLIEERVKGLVVDKDISLDERWALFCKFATKCNEDKDNSLYHFTNKHFDNYIDGREFNKYEDIDIDWELDNYFEEFEDDMNEEELTQNIIEVKEQCLKDFVYSYCYNW